MRVLAVAERAPTTLRCIVRGLPVWVAEECAQSDEVIGIQVLLLSTERRQRVGLGVGLPGTVALLRLGWSSPLSETVLPDGEPRFEKGARQIALVDLVNAQD